MVEPAFGSPWSARPLRVVSVLPSATEMLCFIGGGHLLVGRSHEDNYPASITHLPVVTGQLTEFTTAKDVDTQVSSALSSGQSLYTIDEQLLTTLQPDVILTQDICAVCAIDLQTVQRLASRMSPQPRVVSLNPLGLDDVLDNLLQVGEAVGMQREAQAARAGLEARLRRADVQVAASQAAAAAAVAEPATAAAEGVAASNRQCVAFIEWPDPIYVAAAWPHSSCWQRWPPVALGALAVAHGYRAERGLQSRARAAWPRSAALELLRCDASKSPTLSLLWPYRWAAIGRHSSSSVRGAHTRLTPRGQRARPSRLP